MPVKTQEELFHILKNIDDSLSRSILSNIMQNPHFITEEEFEQWCFDFDKAVKETEEKFAQMMSNLREAHRAMSEYYFTQKEKDEKLINGSF